MNKSVSIASCSIKAFWDGVRCFAKGCMPLEGVEESWENWCWGGVSGIKEVVDASSPSEDPVDDSCVNVGLL